MRTSPWVTWDPALQAWRPYTNDDVKGGRSAVIIAPTIQGNGALNPTMRVVTMRGSMARVEAMHRRFREAA